MKVNELIGGDVIRLGIDTATFIGASAHPNYEGFALVVWIMSDNSYSLDALDWNQEVGFLSSYRNNNIAKLESVLG